MTHAALVCHQPPRSCCSTFPRRYPALRDAGTLDSEALSASRKASVPTHF
jgi:hypothetical protein